MIAVKPAHRSAAPNLFSPMESPIDAEKTVRELGERFVVADVTRAMRPADFLLDGFGHDAAFVDLPRHADDVLVINTDRSGINVAYKLELAGPECIGDLGVSHAVSDVVVAGGVPRAVTVALLLPADSTIGFVRGVMKGAELAAERYGASIVGGDTKQNPKFAIVVTVVGTAPRNKRVRRWGAQPGDSLVVTGYLGSMLLGMMAFGNSLPVGDRARRVLESALVNQRPPFRLGRAVADAGLARAGIDISDGLPGAIHAICDASGVGALVDERRIPLHPELTDLVAASGLGPLQLSSAGGDWQFLYSVPPDRLAELNQVASSVGAVVGVIGTVVERGMLAVRTTDGVWRRLERLEHDSFADGSVGGGHFAKVQTSMSCVGERVDERACERLWTIGA